MSAWLLIVTVGLQTLTIPGVASQAACDMLAKGIQATTAAFVGYRCLRYEGTPYASAAYPKK